MHIVLSLTLLGLSLSCTHLPPGPGGTGTIKGLVLGDHDLQPVNGATITVVQQRRSVTSAPDGTFRITNIPIGEHTLELQGDGMLTQSLREVPVSASDSTCVIIFPRPAVGPGRTSDVLTGPVTEPLLILNGVVRFPSTAKPPRASGPAGDAVIQIRTANIATFEVIDGDSATRLYGQRAALGAIQVTTKPHAPCSQRLATRRRPT